MAYWVRCGAYLPEGQSICLACGYDPEAAQIALREKAEKEKNVKAGAAAAARQYGSKSSNEELRRRLEEQRKRSQEQNRQWAEQERVRREEQAAREEARRKQQEDDRRWAEEEYRRRQAEQSTRSAFDPDTAVRSNAGGVASGEGNKALSALSYLSILFALPYIFTPNDEFAKFHAKQGFKLFVFGIVADILAWIVGLGWIVTLIRFYLIYKGMTNALNGRKEKLPWIGDILE